MIGLNNQVTGCQHALLGQIHHGVTGSDRAAEMKDLNLAPAQGDVQAVGERPRRQGVPNPVLLFQKVAGVVARFAQGG